ncbi:DUF2378 family protein [Cystobacter ferrugineus]|uniref:TIGR02265 family protein n=1 Tax=Cystobacter ferrugineus TaxID=83449 RepID=A0A1L9B6Z4_9BACT|nr:DUF2378 family protein [Cystobacter ferrugineus]OJH37983.1 hypothetical protein BON30_27340 [Cystobacter ferrugineus]
MEQLLALAHPTDTCRGMFFNGLLDTARSLGGEPLRARCLATVGERKFVDFFSYPITDFLRAIFLVAEELGPAHGGTEAVLHLLGRRATMIFAQSTVGKTLLALAGQDPGRVLAAIPNGCRASLSYGERSVEMLGEGHARFLARGDLLPLQYNEGMIAAAIELSSARDVRVRGERRGVLDVDYEVRWS